MVIIVLFRELAEVMERLERTSSRIAMRNILAEFLRKVPTEEIKIVIYFLQGIVSPPYLGLEVGIGEKLLLRCLSLASGYPLKEVERKYGEVREIGKLAEKLIKEKKQMSLFSKDLEIKEVYEIILKASKVSGEGSQDLKQKLLVELFNNASPIEAKHLARFVLGRLRVGVGDPTILEAIAITKYGSVEKREIVERAYNLTSDLGLIAEKIWKGEKIEDMKPILFLPIRPALAERLSSIGEILKKHNGKTFVEYKYDGFRLQIHKKGEKVKIFTRHLEEITEMLPDVVEETKKIQVKEVIFEGEALAYNEEKRRFYSFQETMRRRRKYGIEEAEKTYPLFVFVFDLLYLDGVDYTVKPFLERRKKIEGIFKLKRIKPSFGVLVENERRIKEIFEEAINKGLEGIMAKDPNAMYIAGARKFAWIKYKKSYTKEIDTIDAIILGYYYGKGARRDLLGGLLVGVYNPERGKIETIAKVGSGFTEEEMKELLEILKKIEIEYPPEEVDYVIEPDVWVEPKLVAEIAFDEITKSPQHTCNKLDTPLALRFPRFMRLRTDKGVKEATTTQEVVKMASL